MRIAAPAYNPVKECKACKDREEDRVSAYILAFQVASEMLKYSRNYPHLKQDALIIEIDNFDTPIKLDLETGNISLGSVSFQLLAKYSPQTGLDNLLKEVHSCIGLDNTIVSMPVNKNNYIFSVLLKLVEIFHARCGLQITTLEQYDDNIVWELRLCEEGPCGWITSNGIAKNRFGEELNFEKWLDLRPEKAATYIFGFNKFCSHYAAPI